MYHVKMKEDYVPTPAEMATAANIDGLLTMLMNGELAGIGVCAVNTDGDPSFFYLNKVEEPVLRPVLSRLLGLYEAGQRFKKLQNAPKENRSYLVH